LSLKISNVPAIAVLLGLRSLESSVPVATCHARTLSNRDLVLDESQGAPDDLGDDATHRFAELVEQCLGAYVVSLLCDVRFAGVGTHSCSPDA
jgi:hypothetical protein